MRSRSRGGIYILTFGLFILLFVVYRYGFKDRYLNLSPRTAVVELSKQGKAILIEKHPEQRDITKLELNIKGKLSDNITIYLSENSLSSGTSIRLKAGKLNTSFITKWTKDRAYILIDNPDLSKSQLEIEYQFVSE